MATTRPPFLGFSKSIHLWLPVTGLFISFILLIQANFVNNGILLSNLTFKDVLRELWLILVQVIITLYFVYYLIRYFDKRMGRDFSANRYIIEIVFVVFVCYLINSFFVYLFLKIIVFPELEIRELNWRLHNLLIISQVSVLLIYISLTGFRILKRLQQKQLEIIKLQKEFTETQFDAIKNQLNPHFLFNSLSVLTSLVYDDANKAENFIEKLSGTYRYLLDQREKEAVHISEELEFLKGYVFLVGQRFGNKLIISEEVHYYPHNFYLLPHTLLVILEYIIGSNSMSSANPLKIIISNNNQFLFFRFRQNQKILQQVQVQEQFKNLRERYRESGHEITISKDDFLQQISIMIPLICI